MAKSSTSRKKNNAPEQGEHSSIRIGDISGGVGFAIGPGAKASVTQNTGGKTDEISQVFAVLQKKVDELPEGPDKGIAENAVKALEVEARQGEQANQSNVQKWMKFLAETAPDAWDVAIDTFTNPIKGIGTAFRKIAEKAKAERDGKEV